AGRDRHRGTPDPRTVARAGKRLGLPGHRRRRGLGHRLEGGDPVRAGPGDRGDQGLAEPGNHAAALLVHVDDRQPRLPRHDGGPGRGRRRLTGGMKMRFAMAVLPGAVLAAAVACSGSGGGTSSGAAPAARTLTPATGGGPPPAAAWPTYGRDVA